MKKLNLCLLASAGVVALATSALAANPSWTGANSSWFTASNWSSSAVPTAGDLVTVGNGGTARIDGARATANLASLTISGTGSTVDVQSGGSLSATSINVGNFSSGTLLLSGSTNVTGAIALNNGTLDARVAGTMANLVTLGGTGGTVSAASGTALILSGAISGTGGLTASGAGQVILTANNTYTGSTIINAGATLALGAGAATGSVASGTITDNGLLVLNHSSATVGNFISGTGALNSQGNNTLSANTSYSGLTQILGGTLALSGSGAIASSSGISFSGANNAVLDISGITSSSASVKSISTCVGCTTADATALAGGGIILGNGKTLIITAATGTYMGVISGTGGITINSPGNQILTGANTYSGITNINAGATLQIGNGGTSGTLGTGNVTDAGTLVFNRSDSLSVTNTISGAGAAEEDALIVPYELVQIVITIT